MIIGLLFKWPLKTDFTVHYCPFYCRTLCGALCWSLTILVQILNFIFLFQELKYELEKKEDVVQTSIKEALESVDNNRGDKKDESTQQLQKLKSSTTDLKVRYDTVSSLEITGSG